MTISGGAVRRSRWRAGPGRSLSFRRFDLGWLRPPALGKSAVGERRNRISLC